MKKQANPMLVTIAAILMLAVIIVYTIERSVEASPYHPGLSAGAISLPPS